VLEQPFKATPERRSRDRPQAGLRAARGRARHVMAQGVGVPRTTVRWWLQGYRKRGRAGVKGRWAPGQPRRPPAAVAPPRVEGGQGGPASWPGAARHWPVRRVSGRSGEANRPPGARDGAAGGLSSPAASPVPTHLPAFAGRSATPSRDPARVRGAEKRAQAGQCRWWGQDEGRFPSVPTLRATLGVKGSRPVVGTWDSKALVYSFAARKGGRGP
jgi:hypothetical protein